MTNYIGIDLGTTFSAVATLDETGRPIIVHNEEGVNLTPSVISFLAPNKVEVGESARRILGHDPNTIGRFKRNMGTSETYLAQGAQHTPTALSSLLLKKLKDDAISSIQHIEEAVVTIPANFANEAREETMEAAKLAGLNVKFIINEPTAAALFYAYKTGEELLGNYAVYDLGGGTFDISIVNVANQNVDVVATNGVSKLGGDDFDEALQKVVFKKFKEATGNDLDPGDFTKNDAEEEKKTLSKRDKCLVRVSAQSGRANIDISREEFEEAISSLLAQTEMLCESTLDDAGLSPSDIKEIFLVGGSTRIPCIRESIRRIFKNEPISTANVDEVVALGASLFAAYKSDRKKLSVIQRNSVEKIKVSEITSKCFGVISMGYDEARKESKLHNSVLIKKNEKIPTSVTETFLTIHDGQESVECQVTESSTPETDPRFVKIIWNGNLELPGGRPAGQKVDVTFSYDDNQIMQCSFLDVESKRKTNVDLNMVAGLASGEDEIDKFMVE
jgi:molecular chaperone DnaK